MSDETYTDEKGRRRWRFNDEIAARLKALHDLLVIGGYPPDHAARYPKLGYLISRDDESLLERHRAGRLAELPGVGKTVAAILAELIETGDCAKAREPSDGYQPPPRSVLELTALPGLGAKTARALYAERGVASQVDLKEALDTGALDDFPGLGPALRQKIRES